MSHPALAEFLVLGIITSVPTWVLGAPELLVSCIFLSFAHFDNENNFSVVY